MITVDKIQNRITGEHYGIEIEIDGKIFFVSTDQENWPEIKSGKHPSILNARKVNIPLIALPTLKEMEEMRKNVHSQEILPLIENDNAT